MSTRLTVLLTVVVVAGVLATPVASADELPEDGVITESTKLTMNHEGGIVLGADGITLNCDGHRIYGEGDSGVLLQGRTGVTVKNCVVEGTGDGFSIDVRLYDSHGNTIKNNTSLYPRDHGFTLWYSDDNKVVGNTAYSSESHGFVLVDSDRNELKNNVGSSDGGLAGFHILGSSNNLILDNRLKGYAFGFTIESGPWVGVIHGSDYNTINGNKVSGSETVALYFGMADRNSVSNNLIRLNRSGIGLDNFATNNVFKENRIRDSETEGYVNWALGTATGNLVKENRFCHNGADIDPADDVTSFVQNKFCGPKS
jgi:parallel beta-helix repeat protein